MQGQFNPKIVGATIVGFALVAGAYTVSNFGKSIQSAEQMASVQPAAAPQRVSIAVTDSDNNGIEDWRDAFVTTEPIRLDQTSSSSYTLPDTLTGQMSINFMEGVIRSREYGPFGSSQEEIIQNTISGLGQATDVKLYDTPDISIMDDWDDQDIVNYANTVAATVYRHSIPDLEGELSILHEIVTTKDEARLTELRSLVEVYRGYRDDTLLIPVPAFLAKEHLDLINTYHAIHNDIEAMTKVFDDPAVTLLRLKRYQDDASGLAYALQNMYLALEPHAALFTVDDPAVLFIMYSPNYQLTN